MVYANIRESMRVFPQGKPTYSSIYSIRKTSYSIKKERIPDYLTAAGLPV